MQRSPLWGYHYSECSGGRQAREAVPSTNLRLTASRPHALASIPPLGSADRFRSGRRACHLLLSRRPRGPVASIAGMRSRRIRIPLLPHFGVIAVAPREVDFVDSVPPSYFRSEQSRQLGDSARARPSTYRVSWPGALLSVGEPPCGRSSDGELRRHRESNVR